MRNLDDLIKYENENTSLDFKAIQYKKEKHEDLIKDVMSMANADAEDDRYIIMGVKNKPSGERNILGIKKEDFVDSAIYQQIIKENIEPDIKLDYFPHETERKLLGVLRITACTDDKPYIMKKDFKTLKKGDSFIRKGSHQAMMERRDYDRIYGEKFKKANLKDKLLLSFSNRGVNREIELTTLSVDKISLPSREAAEKIEKVLEEKRSPQSVTMQAQVKKWQSLSQRALVSPFSPLPYEQRSIKELERNLKNVGEIYVEDDHYKFFEEYSHKVNIYVLNQGDAYVEDASIKIRVDAIDGIYVANRVYEKPKHEFFPSILNTPTFESMNYPRVGYEGKSIVISDNIGDIKHRMPTKLFKVPLRIVLDDELAGKTISLKCNIFAKNLSEPFEGILQIKVVAS